MKLYYNVLATNSHRVLATVYQLNAKVELQSVDFQSDFMEQPSFLKINPNGMIPALEDGDFSLWEGNAIMQYICDQSGTNTLYPQNSKIRADIHRWQFWHMAHFGDACDTLMWENALKKMFNAGAPDTTAVQEAMESFRTFGKVLNEHLAKNKFLVADQLTIADFSVGASLTYAIQAQMPVSEFPNIVRWYAEIETQDGWKKSAPNL